MNADATRPTMRDVAAAAEVSLKTVSRVLNGERGVRPATRQRVQRAVDDLAFRRNDLARALRQGRMTATIGLVIGDLANPFYAVLARAVEEAVAGDGYLLVAASSEEQEDNERRLVHALLDRRAAGLLIVPSGADQSYLEPEQRRGSSFVFLDRAPRGLEADAVVLDNLGGARRAVSHLVDKGHRRIGMIGDATTVATSAERLAGYRAQLTACGIAPDPALVLLGSHDAAQAEVATRRLLRLPDPPTAIFTSNNRNTIGVLRALRDVPRPVAVVGFDDFELADMLAPPVTVVSHDPGEMGRRGARLLLERIAGATDPPRHVVLPTRLVVRGTAEVRP